MKNLLFTIFLIIVLGHNSYSQNWQHYDSLRFYYQEKVKYDSALVYADKALLMVKEKVGENDTLYADMLFAIMQVYCNLNQYKKAISSLESEKLLRKTLQGERHPKYASCSDWMGYVFLELGNYAESEKNYLEALAIRKEILGTIHPDYAHSLNVLGLFYCKIGNYIKAEELYIESLKIRKQVLGIKDIYYAESLNNLAVLYNHIGSFKKSEKHFIEALKIREETKGKKSNEYTQSLCNLALLYSDMGQYSEAEFLLNENLTICKEISGNKSIDYAKSLNNLALLYLNMGNYSTAILLYNEALDIIREPLGIKHPNYITTSFSIAVAYKNLEEYSKAEKLYIEIISNCKDALGVKHPLYAKCLNGLAVLYFQTKNFAESERLFKETLEIRKEILGVKHPNYATCLFNLAGLYLAMNKYSEAELLYNESLAIRRETIGIKHPDYINSLINLAYLYNRQNLNNKAESLFIESINSTDDNIRQNFTFLSEREKELYFIKEADKYNKFYSFSLKQKNENPSIVKNVYNQTLKNKGLLLKSSTAMRVAILNSKDSVLIIKYENWVSLKNKISKLYSTEISKRKMNIEELEQQANTLEKALIRGSKVFSDFEKLQNMTWESVKNNLKPGEAAIEFIRFKSNIYKSNINSKDNDTIIYCGLIIIPQSKQPEMIQLFYEKDLEFLLGSNNRNNISYIKSIYGTSENTDERLYKLIWQPMEKYLEGIKTVYYSPDGLLYKISFSSIGKGKDFFLCDNYSLHSLSSTGKIVMPEVFSMDKNNLVGIYGGIEYSTDSTKEKIWQYLPGTKSETDKIDQIFKQKKIKTNYLFGIKAEEKEFKKKASNCNLLHIATHGFFYPEPEEFQKAREKEMEELQLASRSGTKGFGLWQFVMNKNPLMRSGLVLAGANNVWNQQYADNREDGVLTAQEVTQLDLHKTQLVVMSACETGLGDIRGSEGVYGLQRAFKMAGVKFLIMSLWQVPDNETSEFMAKFYEKLLATKDIRKSFNETQTDMRKKYDPFYWAAFVLIE